MIQAEFVDAHTKNGDYKQSLDCIRIESTYFIECNN